MNIITRRSLIVSLLIALFLSVSFVGLVSAHAKLKSAEPAPGAKLTNAPTTVKIIFTEEISADPAQAYFKVNDPTGKIIATGALDKDDLDHTTLIATLPTGLANGVYTVNWRSFTPDDSGIATGTFSFGINADPGPQGDTAGEEQEAATTPTVAPTKAATPVPTKAAATATTIAATATPEPTKAAAPSTLPHTADESGPGLAWLLAIGAGLILAAGLTLRRSLKRP